ncbi:MAG: hypothetical protein ACFE8L_13390 [Candidatus Hodarchaeota archaeon]
MYRHNDNLEEEAEKLENQSKEEFNKKNYTIAISLLNEAKEVYKQLGYEGKVGIIQKRISQMMNLMAFEKQDTYIRTENEAQFQKRVDKVLTEKKKHENRQMESLKDLPPQIKRKLEKINLLKEKAEKELKLGRIERVKGRYEYIIELYKSIPKNIINSSFQILEIERKLSSLGDKIQNS